MRRAVNLSHDLRIVRVQMLLDPSSLGSSIIVTIVVFFRRHGETKGAQGDVRPSRAMTLFEQFANKGEQ